MKEHRVVMTGGGTGGHIFPAIAIADALKAAHPNTAFLFVGAEGKMEMERVPQAGYAIEGLPVAGFQRTLNWENIKRNLSLPYKLWRSNQKAKEILGRFRPDVVIGTGGYASGPVMRAAQSLGIPTLIQEQNSYPGVTNRILAKKAAAICTAYEGMEAYFPKEKIVLTGNPVRQDILGIQGKKSEGRSHFGLDPQKRTIFVTGGSLGARTLNEAVAAKADLLKQHADEVQLLWQCGKFYYEQCRTWPVAQLPNVKMLPFIDRVDLAYAASSVVIARAGALTVSELCLVGRPAILVPSPNVAEDHQTKNALALTQIGAARLVRDADAVEKMLEEAFLILENDALAFSLSESIRQLGKPRAAKTIADQATKLMTTA